MKVVLVHDWLIHMRGGEKVLEALAEMYPEAPIYTLFCDRKHLSPVLMARQIHTSFLQKLPGIKKYYRWLLPVLPLIIKILKLPDVNLVISTSHCVAKGVRVPRQATHLCYCHTPMRYIWGFEDIYFSKMNPLIRPLIYLSLKWLRYWDIRSNRGVDEFISNSENVRRRIFEFYGRDSHVVHPPADLSFFHPCAEKEDYYLAVSAFVPYKRIDLVIRAFNGLDRRLKIVGAGPMADEYRALATSSQIEFLGGVPDTRLRELLSSAKAVIFPTDEDFGIVPVEAQACGTPVIALERGGALESVKTGVFFSEQSPEAIRDAVFKFEKKTFDPAETAKLMQPFSKTHFKEKIKALVRHILESPAHEAAEVR